MGCITRFSRATCAQIWEPLAHCYRATLRTLGEPLYLTFEKPKILFATRKMCSPRLLVFESRRFVSFSSSVSFLFFVPLVWVRSSAKGAKRVFLEPPARLYESHSRAVPEPPCALLESRPSEKERLCLVIS